MADERNTDKGIPRDRAGRDAGILPDGIRGTTRDIDHTVPSDEYAGHPDPTKPDLRKPSPPK